MLRKIRHVLSLIVLILSVMLIMWAALPNPRESIVQPISNNQIKIPTGAQGSATPRMEARQIVLEWPHSMRIGESGEIILKFEPLDGGTDLQNLSNGTIDIYSTNNIMAEARFEVAGITVNPVNPRRESMPAGQTVRFKWEVGTDEEGSYAGTVWLSLRLLPLDGGEAMQMPIYIQQINLKTTSLLGLNESMAYWLGGLGLLLAAALVYDDWIALVRKGTRTN